VIMVLARLRHAEPADIRCLSKMLDEFAPGAKDLHLSADKSSLLVSIDDDDLDTEGDLRGLPMFSDVQRLSSHVPRKADNHWPLKLHVADPGQFPNPTRGHQIVFSNCHFMIPDLFFAWVDATAGARIRMVSAQDGHGDIYYFEWEGAEMKILTMDHRDNDDRVRVCSDCPEFIERLRLRFTPWIGNHVWTAESLGRTM
jgi:hypothetical protein